MARIHTAKNEDVLLVTQNQDSLKVYGRKPRAGVASDKWISLNPDDCCADLVYQNNIKCKLEFYYGSAYLSQSSRKIPVSKNVAKMIITNYKGVKREVGVF